MKGIKRKTLLILLSSVILIITGEPAHANAPMTWGGIAGGAQAAIGFTTGGIGFIAITIAEAWVFKKYLGLTWRRGLLVSVMINLISSAIGGLLAFAAFSFGVEGIFIGSLVTIVLVIRARTKGMPWYYTVIIIPTLIIGTIGVFPGRIIILQSNPLIIYGMMLLPLVLGFGLTLLYEGMIAHWFLRGNDFWKALLIANCISYLILAIALPLSPIKAHRDSQWFLSREISNQIVVNKPSPEEVVAIIRRSHGSNLYLLGLTGHSSPPSGYDAEMELNGLKYSFGHISNNDPSPDLGIAVAEEALTYDSLTDTTRIQFEWTIDYLEHWKQARDSIISGDQEALEYAYHDWVDWVEGSTWPDGVLGFVMSPADVIQLLIRNHEAVLEVPVENSELEN